MKRMLFVLLCSMAGLSAKAQYGQYRPPTFAPYVSDVDVNMMERVAKEKQRRYEEGSKTVNDAWSELVSDLQQLRELYPGRDEQVNKQAMEMYNQMNQRGMDWGNLQTRQWAMNNISIIRRNIRNAYPRN